MQIPVRSRPAASHWQPLAAIAVASFFGATTLPAKEAPSCADRVAEAWLAETLGPPPPEAGTLEGRQRLETPVWLHGASISGVKYAVSIKRGPDTGAVGLSGLSLGPLKSRDAYGAAIRVQDQGDAGAEEHSAVQLFLHDIEIAPDWPDWISYEETNYDAVDFEAPGELYGHAVRIYDWNADAALDIKADRSQFVDLVVSGSGNRPLRYWRPGPHDLVASDISRPDEGPIVWFADCATATLRVFETRFNGSDRLAPERVSCGDGEVPEIIYLSEDPRLTGDVHPMLRGCPEEG